jgi:putative restriction endonuclease
LIKKTTGSILKPGVFIMLDKYLKSFSRLRTYKDRKKWSGLTTYQAPHKPFLLLSIMDLIAQGAITHNFIKSSFELVETFNPNIS